jgi:hypothetical protein
LHELKQEHKSGIQDKTTTTTTLIIIKYNNDNNNDDDDNNDNGLDDLGKRKISCSCQKWNHNSLATQPVVLSTLSYYALLNATD